MKSVRVYIKKHIPRKILSVLVVGCIVVGITSCSNEKAKESVVDSASKVHVQNNRQNTTIVEDTSVLETEKRSEKQVNQQASKYELSGYAQSFSEGYAWVICRDPAVESSSRYGCIDKTGKVILSMPSNALPPSAFDEGYSYAKQYGDNVLYAIATDGSVTKYGNENDNKVRILAYGGGYVIVGRYDATFDSDEYVFEIQDSKATTIESFTLAGDEIDDKSTGLHTLPIYCGQGVFGFQLETNGGHPTDFYCCKTNKWVKEAASDEVEFIDDSDTAYLGVNYGESNNQLVFMTSAGEISRYTLPETIGNIWHTCVSDNKCIIHDFNNHFYLYDLSSETLKQMPSEYESSIKNDYYKEGKPFFNEGLCVMVAEGADGDDYIEVFDENWNRQFEPIKTIDGWEFLYYSNGTLSIEPRIEQGGSGFTEGDSAIYDKSGNQLWTSDGFLSPMSDGLFLHAEDAGFGSKAQQMPVNIKNRTYTTGRPIDFLDKDGKPAFESLDMSSAKEVVLD